jgi:hypothetical protein
MSFSKKSLLDCEIKELNRFLKKHSLQEDVVKFTSYLIKLWLNLNKFTMVIMANPLVNKD